MTLSISIEPNEKCSNRIPISKGFPFTLGSVKRSVDVPVVQQILDFSDIGAGIEQQRGSRGPKGMERVC